MLLMATLQGRAFHSLYLVDLHGGGGGVTGCQLPEEFLIKRLV